MDSSNTNTMRAIFKCSPKRFVKFTIVCVSVIGLIIYFPREKKPTPNVYKARPLDYVDPDVQLRRDPGLVNFVPRSVISFKPTKYTRLGSIRFNHTCKARLKVGGSDTKICVYGRDLDNMVSSFVTDHGTWEKEQLDTMEIILRQNKDMQVVDLGCNIGIYTLFASKMKRRVIAVDPLESNLQLLHTSLMLGHYLDNVTLVHNAISDHAEKVAIDLRVGNIGGTHVNPLQDAIKPHKRVKRYKRLGKRLRNKQNVKKSLAQNQNFKSNKKDQKRSAVKDPRKSFQFKIPNIPKQNLNQNIKPVIPNSPQKNNVVMKVNPKPNPPKILKPFNVNDHDINKLLPGKRIGPVVPVVPKPAAAWNKLPTIKPESNLKFKETSTTRKPRKDPLNNKKPKKPKKKESKKSNSDNSSVFRQDKTLVQAVTMDDLVQLGSFRPTFLKMDIEGWEYLALRKASVFLHVFDVRYIMMEWTTLRRSSNGGKVVSYLMKNGFLPYKNDKKEEFLNVQNPGGWPDNVLWRKR